MFQIQNQILKQSNKITQIQRPDRLLFIHWWTYSKFCSKHFDPCTEATKDSETKDTSFESPIRELLDFVIKLDTAVCMGCNTLLNEKAALSVK